MIYPIYLYGEDILRKKAEEIKDFNDSNLHVLIDDMFETMNISDGIGLAAPQIGISKQIITIQLPIASYGVKKYVFINPKILKEFGQYVTVEEGCLSLPDIHGNVKRRDAIELEWYGKSGKFYRQYFSGILSRILQHEIDHLNGILMIDKFEFTDKLLNFMKLEKIKDKKVETKYPIK